MVSLDKALASATLDDLRGARLIERSNGELDLCLNDGAAARPGDRVTRLSPRARRTLARTLAQGLSLDASLAAAAARLQHERRGRTQPPAREVLRGW